MKNGVNHAFSSINGPVEGQHDEIPRLTQQEPALRGQLYAALFGEPAEGHSKGEQHREISRSAEEPGGPDGGGEIGQ